jgi:hypothetical protein
MGRVCDRLRIGFLRLGARISRWGEGRGGEPLETEVVAERRSGAGGTIRWQRHHRSMIYCRWWWRRPYDRVKVWSGMISTVGCRGCRGGDDDWPNSGWRRGGGGATSAVVNGRAFPKGAESMDAWRGARGDGGATKSQRKSRDGGDDHAFPLTGDPSEKTITHLP